MREPTMPDLFDQLAATTQAWADKAPDPYEFALTSKRVVTDSDSRGLVTVTMDDFKVASISVDPVWASEPHRTMTELTEPIVEAVNTVLKAYLVGEFSEAKNGALPMNEISDKLKELSADFTVAYEKSLSRLQERGLA